MKPFNAFNPQQLGLKSAHARSNHNGFSDELVTRRGFNKEFAVGAVFKRIDGLTQVKRRTERLCLLEKAGRQFTSCTALCTRNVVDRFVGVQLNALAAHIRQRINHMGFYLKQSELKDLKQASRTRTNDECIGLNWHGAFGCQS